MLGYLQDFLFTPERARAPITRLSGGERNRLLLARLFAQPSNLLVMDEPTNDLDVETLELLEELLGEYAGTLLLVSHDRDFLDNVVTSTLVLQDGAPAASANTSAATATGCGNVRRRRRRATAAEIGVRLPGRTLAPAPVQAQAQLQGHARTRSAARADRSARNGAGAADVTDERSGVLSTGRRWRSLRTTSRWRSAQAELDAAYARWEELEAG